MSQLTSIPIIQKLLDFTANNKYTNQLFKKREKAVTVSISIALSLFLVHYVREKFRPPKQLRHIPVRYHLSEVITTVIRGEYDREEKERVVMSYINSDKNIHDVYLKNVVAYWLVCLSDPEDCKRLQLKYEKMDNPLSGFEDHLLSKFIGGENLLLSKGTKWKKQRMIANPAFHRNMPIKLFGTLTSDLFSVIDHSGGENIDFTDLMKRFTLEAIGRAGFGFEFNAIKDKNSEWIQIYSSVNEGLISTFFAVFPGFEKKFWLNFFPHRKSLHEKMNQFLVMLNDIIAQKRAKLLQGDIQNDDLEENEKDILTLLIEGEMSGDAMTNDELRANLGVFFFAGHDTTSSSLSSAIYQLAVHPNIQQKAREEAISILGDEPMDVFPTISDTKGMKYIDQIIKEVLRLNNPVSDPSARYLTEDMVTTSGLVIPKGSIVAVDIYALHHSKKVWKDPYVFNPDRFDEGAEIGATRKKNDWYPFGGGPRQCIGMNFSLNEQRVLLSMILRKYEWSLPKDSIHKDGLQFEGFIVSTPKKLDINFKRRY